MGHLAGVTCGTAKRNYIRQFFPLRRKCRATSRSTADPSLLERNLVVAQGQRHRARRDTSIQIRLIENLSDLRRPMRNGVSARAGGISRISAWLITRFS
jgi:hypothetical protein